MRARAALARAQVQDQVQVQVAWVRVHGHHRTCARVPGAQGESAHGRAHKRERKALAGVGECT